MGTQRTPSGTLISPKEEKEGWNSIQVHKAGGHREREEKREGASGWVEELD